MIRVAFFHGSLSVALSNIDAARILIDQGGDWDRRNRLKVYQALYHLYIRDFKTGAQLLLDTMPTFTATELVPYDEFIALAIIAGQLSLPRKDIKAKIIESPEVIATLPSLTPLKDYTTALFDSEYAKFFKALAEVETHYLIPSLVLHEHARYYVREMRIKAYTQLLESYRSMTIGNLADAFGVGESYIEK
jgi:26S proteasome regulatory subunit N7